MDWTNYAETLPDDNWSEFNDEGFLASDKDLTDVVRTNVGKIYDLEHPHKKRDVDLLHFRSRILFDDFSAVTKK